MDIQYLQRCVENIKKGKYPHRAIPLGDSFVLVEGQIRDLNDLDIIAGTLNEDHWLAKLINEKGL